MALRRLRADCSEIIVETSSVEVRTECRPFDVHICDFEIEQ